jgi:hypothetical protein
MFSRLHFRLPENSRGTQVGLAVSVTGEERRDMNSTLLDGAASRCAATILLTLAVAVCGSVLAAPAVAAAPELGRCVAVAAGTGEFKGETCIERAKPGEGEWDWIPGPGPHPGFSANFGYSFASELTISTANKTIYCPFNVSEGEYTGPKTLKMTMLLWQCHTPYTGEFRWDKLCQEYTTGNRPPGRIVPGRPESEIGQIHLEVTGKIGFYEPSKVGLELKSTTEPVLTVFECGGASQQVQLGTGTGTSMELEGGVVGHWLSTYEAEQVTNHMVTNYAIKYKATGGVQEPESLSGGTKDTLTLVSPLVGLERNAEPAVLSAEEEVEAEEPIELNTRA